MTGEMKGIYTAIFEQTNNGVCVRVPDLPGCVTSGEDIMDAYEMILDAANLWMTAHVNDFGKDPPEATPMEEIATPNNCMKMLIPIDTDAYMYALRREVERNKKGGTDNDVSIPE